MSAEQKESQPAPAPGQGSPQPQSDKPAPATDPPVTPPITCPAICVGTNVLILRSTLPKITFLQPGLDIRLDPEEFQHIKHEAVVLPIKADTTTGGQTRPI